MHPHRSLRLPRGLTLTETLTALVLLAIGVLCIATVYLERTQAAPAVLLHSKANRLAQEMAERMQARYADRVHFENPVGIRCNPRLVGVPPQRLASNDIACWQDKVAETLPNGSGAIARDNQHLSPAYLITVSWSPPTRGTASFLLRVTAPDLPATLPKATGKSSETTRDQAPAQASTKSEIKPPLDSKPVTPLPQDPDVTRAAN